MSDTVRLTLVSHAMTDAMSAGRFPIDEPVNDLGRRQLAGNPTLGSVDLVNCGPERRAVQTAELLGLDTHVDPRLADLDYGRWRGLGLDAVESDGLAVWLTDPHSAPHGGESVIELIARVREWLDALTVAPMRVAAVTHPSVVRAAVLLALDAPPKSFWRIHVEPLSRTRMHRRGQAWNLRLG